MLELYDADSMDSLYTFRTLGQLQHKKPLFLWQVLLSMKFSKTSLQHVLHLQKDLIKDNPTKLYQTSNEKSLINQQDTGIDENQEEMFNKQEHRVKENKDLNTKIKCKVAKLQLADMHKASIIPTK